LIKYIYKLLSIFNHTYWPGHGSGKAYNPVTHACVSFKIQRERERERGESYIVVVA
jgi:hypothetical protein